MKILFISPNSPDLSVGGVERHIQNLINYCCQTGKEAFFLMPSCKTESYEKVGPVTIIKKDFLNVTFKKIFNKKQVQTKDIKEKSKDFFVFLKDLINKEKIQMVSVQNFHYGLPPVYSLMLNMVCFLENVPMVLRIHSFIKTDLQKSLINDLYWHKILCVSKSVAGDCFAKGTGIDKMRVHYLGVSRKEFRPFLEKDWLKKEFNLPQNSKIILHASRIISGSRDILKEKGILNLLEAFSMLVAKDPSFRLVLAIGTPPKHLKAEFHYALDKIRGYAQLHDIESKIVLREFPLDKMPLVYNGADVFVLASENETFGQVFIEAMSCGIPVIGTNVGGVPEIIIDNFNGFLIEPNNPSVLTKKIEDLFNDAQLRKMFVENGFKTIRRKFSSDRQFSNLFNYLKRFLIAEKFPIIKLIKSDH